MDCLGGSSGLGKELKGRWSLLGSSACLWIAGGQAGGWLISNSITHLFGGWRAANRVTLIFPRLLLHDPASSYLLNTLSMDPVGQPFLFVPFPSEGRDYVCFDKCHSTRIGWISEESLCSCPELATLTDGDKRENATMPLHLHTTSSFKAPSRCQLSRSFSSLPSRIHQTVFHIFTALWTELYDSTSHMILLIVYVSLSQLNYEGLEVMR